MKLHFIFILFLFQESLAQNSLLPIAENGKYTFMEIVELPEINKENLYKNGSSFMQKIKVIDSNDTYLIQDTSTNTIQTKGSFSVHNYGSIKKHTDGVVNYSFLLEIKDGKYRYTITDFTFIKYARNRYGKFVPLKGKTTPLETESSKLNSKNWIHYRKEVYDKSLILIQNLNASMKFDETTDQIKIKKETNW